MGKRLKIAKIIFIQTVKANIKNNPGAEINNDEGINRISNPKISATIILEAGPETATFKGPHFWSLKLYGFIGTGFAQPIKNWLPLRNKRSGRITEPNGSKCFRGFKVRRPAYFAVGSPNE